MRDTLHAVTVDHFPSTHATWIDAQLMIAEEGERAAAGGDAPGAARAERARSALRRHVMERYAAALGAYASAGGLRGAGERDDLVSGFFAGPLADEAFFRRWRSSGMPLRRWLMNAMSFHCRGIRRDAARERERRGASSATEAEPHAAAQADAARAFDRAWALSIVNEAYGRVQRDLAENGRGGEDEVLRMHVIDGMPYEQVAAALGMSRAECFNAVRRTAGRIRDAVVELLREEGVPGSELEAALAEVMRLVGQ